MKSPATIASAVLIAMIIVSVISAPEASAGKNRVEPAPTSTAVAAPQGTGEAARKPAEAGAKSQGKSDGLAAIERAAKAGKYLFVFLYKDSDQQVGAARAAFDQATKKVRNRAKTGAVNIADPAEKTFVDKLKLAGAPTPLVLVLAPNGAITAGFQTQLDDKQVADAFVSPCTEKCLKALQDGKLVLLCVQNAASRSRSPAMQGVTAFKSDPRFSPMTEVITVNPADAKEADFLSKLQVDPKTGEAITVLMAPPGGVVRKFAGATDKGVIVAAVNSLNSGGCGSGSKSGCCPK